MITLERSSDATRLWRVVNDALWSLDHGHVLGAQAMLRNAVQEGRDGYGHGQAGRNPTVQSSRDTDR